jgi:phospholipid/cholesterol/gamma-HCH transport system substrate-binding protein
MSSNTSSQSLETIVGAAVVALAVGFFAYAYNTAGVGGGSIGDGYKLIAEFDNAEGINVGTDVRLAGIKIGTVVGQSLNAETYQARIEMMVEKRVQLSDDSAAKITSEGLLGGKFITLEPGGSDKKFAEGDSFSYTQGAVDIWSLISQAMFSKSEDKKPDETPPADPPAEPAPQ